MSNEVGLSKADTIDAVAGIAPGSFLAALRQRRPEIVALSQRSEDAAIRPEREGSFGYGLRAALACRIARLLKDDELSAHYRAMLGSSGRAVHSVADGATAGEDDPPLTAILRHVDFVTLAPEKATRDDIDALHAAGFSNADIVTLSGIIAFVNYQARVIAGLRMLKAGQ